MKKTFFLLALVLMNVICIKAQKNDCLTDFDYLVKKIKDDYPGYNEKVTASTKDKLQALELNLRKRLKSYPDSCGFYLREYASFFRDNHLRVHRVSESVIRKSKKILEVSSYGKNVVVNSDSLFKATADVKTIEGVWKGFSDEFAIIKKGNGYIGVAINARDWNKNQVMYEFIPINGNDFQIIEHTLVDGYKTRTGKASLFLSGKILEFHDDTRFVRKSNSSIFDKALLYSYTPTYPNGSNTYWVATYLSDSTYYLRIPGFDGEESNEVVKKHWNEIISRPNLIIDIRNNGGGLDNFFENLLKLIYTKPYFSKGAEWYATKANIKMYEDALKNGEINNAEEGIKWTKTLIEAMKKNIGGFVIHPMMRSDEAVKRDTILQYPKKIGIIINEGNASSAEQFLLAAKESDKVILFGNQNTAGVLDYSNAISETFPSGKYELTYPMTRSRRLPENPIDNIGIAPNIIIPFPSTEQLYDRLDSWVYFVKNYLELKQ